MRLHSIRHRRYSPLRRKVPRQCDCYTGSTSMSTPVSAVRSWWWKASSSAEPAALVRPLFLHFVELLVELGLQGQRHHAASKSHYPVAHAWNDDTFAIHQRIVRNLGDF